MKSRTWWAVLAASAFVAASCGSSGDSGSDGSGVDDGGAESATEVAGDDADEAGDAAGADETTDDTRSASDEDAMAEATPLEIGGPVAAGIYETDLMGTPVTLDLDREWLVPAGDPGGVVFVDPDAASTTANTILLTRMNSLAGPGEADTEPRGLAMSGPHSDLGAWIDAVGELIAEGPVAVELDGASATQFQVTVDPDGESSIPGGCGPTADDRCLFVGATSSQTLAFFIVRTTEVYRMWMIDQGEHEGLLVTAIAGEGDEAWLDDYAEAFVAGLTIGESAPHPVELPEGSVWEVGFPSVVPAGPAVFPAHGGMTLDLPYETFVFQDGSCFSVDAEADSDSPFAPNVRINVAYQGGGNAGAPIESVDDWLAVARDGMSVEPNGKTITVFGTDLEGYDLVDDPAAGPPIGENEVSCAPKGDAGSNQGGYPGPRSTVYLAPYDGGVLEVAADAFTVEELLIAEELLEQLLPTIALTE